MPYLKKYSVVSLFGFTVPWSVALLSLVGFPVVVVVVGGFRAPVTVTVPVIAAWTVQTNG